MHVDLCALILTWLAVEDVVRASRASSAWRASAQRAMRTASWISLQDPEDHALLPACQSLRRARVQGALPRTWWNPYCFPGYTQLTRLCVLELEDVPHALGAGALWSAEASLQELRLTRCPYVLPEDFRALARCAQLATLRVCSCPVDDACLGELRGSASLRQIELTRCYHVTNRGFQALRDCRSVREIEVRHNLYITWQATHHLMASPHALTQLRFRHVPGMHPSTAPRGAHAWWETTVSRDADGVWWERNTDIASEESPHMTISIE